MGSDLTENNLKQVREATAKLQGLTEAILRMAAPVFQPPPFFDASLPPSDLKWPSSLSEANRIDAEVMASVGALMREWAKTELMFDAAMRQMANYPQIAGTPLAQQLELYSFKAKSEAWKRLQKSLFIDDDEHLKLSQFVLSKAKALSSIRNEIAHWNTFPSGDSSVLGLFSNAQKMWSRWPVASLTAASVEIEHLRTALTAFTQMCFFRWVRTYSPSLEIPDGLASDTGLLLLRSYRVRCSAARPPRKRGLPPQPAPSPR